MNKTIKKLRNAVQVLLLAPVKLPSKLLQVVKYVALALGLLEAVVDEGQQRKELEDDE